MIGFLCKNLATDAPYGRMSCRIDADSAGFSMVEGLAPKQEA